MDWVMVERSFPAAVAFEEIQALEDAGAWCLETHQVAFLKTYFSKDRRRMLCLYRAPDAEAVRRAERQARVPFDIAWTCGWIEGSAGPNRDEIEPAAREHVVVERTFDEPVPLPTLRTLIDAGKWCFDSHRSIYLGGYLARDGRRMVCHFRGPDAESIRAANRQLELPVRSIWTATLHGR